MNADRSFLTACAIEQPQPVNLRSADVQDWVTPSRSDGVCAALTLYHNAAHKHLTLTGGCALCEHRPLGLYLRVICDKILIF